MTSKKPRARPKAVITHDGSAPFTVCVSDGQRRVPISPPYRYLTEAKIFRKAFDMGRTWVSEPQTPTKAEGVETTGYAQVLPEYRPAQATGKWPWEDGVKLPPQPDEAREET